MDEDQELNQTLAVEAESDIHALIRILDRIAVLQLRCVAVRASFDASNLKVVAELSAAPPERLALLVNRLTSMPGARSATILSNANPHARL